MVVLIGFSLDCDFMDFNCVQTKFKHQLIISNRMKLKFVLSAPPLDIDHNHIFTAFETAGCIIAG